MSNLESIRVGDRFQHANGVWEVFATKPGGVVELWDAKRYRSMNSYTRCIRAALADGSYKRTA